MTTKAKKAHPNLLIIMPHQLVLWQAVFSSLLPIRSRPLPCPIHSTAVQPPFPPTAFFAWAAANPALHRPRKRPPSPRCLPPVLSPAAGKGDRFSAHDPELDGKGLLANPNHCRGPRTRATPTCA